MTDIASDLVVRTLTGLLAQGDDATRAFLLGACYALAISQDTTPTDVAEELFRAVPDADRWPDLRRSLLNAAEETGPV